MRKYKHLKTSETHFAKSQPKLLFYIHVSMHQQNANYEQMVDVLKHGFEIANSEAQRCLLPSTVVASMLTIQPWPIRQLSAEW